MKIVTAVLLMIPMLVSHAFALEYEINVARRGGNLYWAAAEKIYIQTEYCFEDAETAALLLRMDGDSGEITFNESGVKCDVKMVYGQTQLQAGEYRIKVNWEDDNWYRIEGQEVALNTNGCLSMVESMEGRLQINEEGPSILSLPDADEECTVDGVFSKAKIEITQGE
ncbi:MAG: hypothetical protein PF441_12965 [Desulfuromusa sp.]|jgi:uncharacterized protein (DUF779 family)|nr:hypothetical protein [Desulfuromusa sp.]